MLTIYTHRTLRKPNLNGGTKMSERKERAETQTKDVIRTDFI